MRWTTYLAVSLPAGTLFRSWVEADRRSDLALLDLQLPGPDGIEVARRLATELPECRCVIVTSHGRPGYLKSALAAGVRAFLPKTVSSRTLAEVVRKVAGGGRHEATLIAAGHGWI